MQQSINAAWLGAFLITAGGAISSPAMAAPFCLQNQMLTPQCIYFDAQQCEQDARRQGGACAANPLEVRLTQGTGEYCVVTSARVSLCIYADRQSCARDAARQHGACTTAIQSAPPRQPDPYSPLNGQ